MSTSGMPMAQLSKLTGISERRLLDLLEGAEPSIQEHAMLLTVVVPPRAPKESPDGP